MTSRVIFKYIYNNLLDIKANLSEMVDVHYIVDAGEHGDPAARLLGEHQLVRVLTDLAAQEIYVLGKEKMNCFHSPCTDWG